MLEGEYPWGGAFASFFVPTPGPLDSLCVPTPGNLPIFKKKNAGIDWRITQYMYTVFLMILFLFHTVFLKATMQGLD